MKCNKCNTRYNNYATVERTMIYFCNICHITTWIGFPKYIPKEQREKYGDSIFAKDRMPQHLMVACNK
jgi:hypothetical protein